MNGLFLQSADYLFDIGATDKVKTIQFWGAGKVLGASDKVTANAFLETDKLERIATDCAMFGYVPFAGFLDASFLGAVLPAVCLPSQLWTCAKRCLK